MNSFKRIFKQNTHNKFLGSLAGFGRAMNRFYENRNHDVFSNGEGTVLKKINMLQPQIIFDGGANVGDYSLIAQKFCPEAKVYSFEPVVSTFELLKKNISSNEKIIAVNSGLFSENTSKEIMIYNSHTHSSLFDIKGIDYAVKKKETIELISGDSFIEQHKISKVDLLKLDVEGAEMEALKGFENSLKSQKVRAIQFEYGYINITSKNLLVDYYDFFRKYNFIVGKIYPKHVEFRDYKFKHEDFIGPNYLAIHESDTALKNILSRI